MLCGCGGHRIEIASCRAGSNAAIGEGCDHGAIGCVETYDDVPVTGQVFRKRCEIGAQGSAPGTQDDDRIHCPFAGHICVVPTVRLDTSEIPAEKFAEDKALMLFQCTPPIRGKIFRCFLGERRCGWVPDPNGKILFGAGNWCVGIYPCIIRPNVSCPANLAGTTGRRQRCRPAVVDPQRCEQDCDTSDSYEGEHCNDLHHTPYHPLHHSWGSKLSSNSDRL